MTETICQTDSVRQSRTIERLVVGQATTDGAGVNLIRVLTQPLQQRLDPFLMLDAFGSDDPDDYIAGFPDHPHRGFETLTYMIAGRMLHRDSAGHEGLIETGGVQWMTAGETSDGARVLLVAGNPLREPIVQQGPFVMNTMQEIQQAVRDYSAGRLA